MAETVDRDLSRDMELLVGGDGELPSAGYGAAPEPKSPVQVITGRPVSAPPHNPGEPSLAALNSTITFSPDGIVVPASSTSTAACRIDAWTGGR